jgi:hypothetical protein
MKRPVFWTFLLITAAATALAAQEQQPAGNKQEQPGADKKDDKKQPVDKTKEIMTRLAKNLAAVEELLKKPDPGDETRKLQRDIIDDLDELIKQQSKSQGGGGGAKSKKDQQKQDGSKGGQKDKNDNSKDGQKDKQPGGGQDKQGPKDKQNGDQKAQDKPGKGDQGQGQDKDKNEGKDGNDKQGTSKDGGKEPDKKGGKDEVKKGEVKPSDNKNQSGEQSALGKPKQDPPLEAKANLNQNRYDWAHLPEKMRLEMDTYSKERFMPRYEDLLQQYYRVIAEQSQGKE